MKEKMKTSDPKIISLSNREATFFTLLSDSMPHDIGILRIKEIIDKTTDMIFITHKERLLSEPITYIVQAVWGKKDHGKLTFNQRRIKKNITTMILNIMEILDFDAIDESQRFSIEYLIRGLAVSKISYLVEVFKNQPKVTIKQVKEHTELIENLKTLGNA